MKRFVWTLGLVLTGAAICIAQPPGGQRGGGAGGPGGGPGGPGGPGGNFQPPPNPVIEVLDINGDHVISAEEIQSSPASLLKLDTNKDGKLTEDEFRPRPPGGPGGGPGGQPGMRQQRERQSWEHATESGERAHPGDWSTERRSSRGRTRQRWRRRSRSRWTGGPGGDGPPGPNPERMTEHAMEFDADKDGKLSREELAKFAEDFAKHHAPQADRVVPTADLPEVQGRAMEAEALQNVLVGRSEQVQIRVIFAT